MEDTTIEDVLKTVADLYAQKEYQKALEILTVNKNKISEGVWHYNVGTIYGKLENLPMARYHLIEAEWKGANSKEVIDNKIYIESKLEIPTLEKPLSPSDYFVKGAITSSQGILTSVSLLILISALIVFWKKKSFVALMTGIALFSTVIGLNFWIISWDKMIVTNVQEIKEGPSEIFGLRGEIPPGLMIVGNKKGIWIEIVYPSRYQGWIKNSGLKELE